MSIKVKHLNVFSLNLSLYEYGGPAQSLESERDPGLVPDFVNITFLKWNLRLSGCLQPWW